MKNVETSIISNSRHILNMRLDLLPCDSLGSNHKMVCEDPGPANLSFSSEPSY